MLIIEVCFKHNGCAYNAIYGGYVNGGYIAVPSHGKCCQARLPDDVFYNCDSLERCGFDSDVAETIALAIKKAL